MDATRTSPCGRFLILNDLHLDRTVIGTLATWAATRGLHLQDAIQIALAAFNEASRTTEASPAMQASVTQRSAADAPAAWLANG